MIMIIWIIRLRFWPSVAIMGLKYIWILIKIPYVLPLTFSYPQIANLPPQWSRFSGGDGAPFWTLAACGINPHNLTATQASILHCEYPTPQSPNPTALPAMIWSTNYGRLLSKTLFTLFFAGRSYAPKCIIDNLNIQDWLQSHYIKACGTFADRIANFENGRLLDECVIGWDSLNEPFEGFCGWEDLNVNPNRQGSTLKKGTFPTPAQSLRLGMGMKQTVENWSFGKMGPVKDGQVTIDPKGLKMWAEPINPAGVDGERLLQGELPDGRHTKWGWKRDVESWPLGTCIWALHGVWDIETGYILQPDYFKFKYDFSSSPSSSSLQPSPNAIIQSEPVEFLIDHWKPHFIAYATRIRQSHPLAILFIQPPVFAPPPPLPESTLQGRCAYAPHYYDGLTLVTRHWNWFNADALGLIRGKYGHGMWSSLRAVKIGESAIRKSLQEQLGYLKDDVGLISACADHDDDETDSDNEDPNTPHPTLHPKYPTVIGEIGTPFDMDSKKSYGYTDNGKYVYDYTSQTKALDASLNGCDGGNGLSWTVWGYVPDDHTWEWGDGWNMEDLSLWSWGDWRDENEKDEDGDVDGMNSHVVLMSQPAESMPMVVTSPSKIVAASSSLSLSSSISSSGTPRLRSSASAPSIPSSSTLPSYSSSLSQLNLRGYSPNPYDFLTNGARAVQAFARPWPTKVVGKPVDIAFDVGKGVFRLEVEVRKGDGVLLGRSGVGKRGKKGGKVDVRVVPVDDLSDEGVEAEERKRVEEREQEDEEGLATEIYIPLVHYAHPKILEDSWMAGGGRSKNRSEGDTLSALTRRRGASNATAASDPAISSSSSPSTSASTLTSPPTDPSTTNPTHNTNTNHNPKYHHHHHKIINQSMDSTSDLVDIQVEVSGGKWSVRGQTLKWWYEVPPGSPSKSQLGGGDEEEPVKKYTIEIKRRGGPIHIDSNERGGEGPRGRGIRGRTSCEECCKEDGACLVM